MKTNELTGAALDWAVAMAEWIGHQFVKEDRFLKIFMHQNRTGQGYCHSRDWAQAGPIIERERLWLQPEIGKEGADNAWYCVALSPFDAYGPTPLVAAMRCYVAYKLGDEVDVPDEICR